MTKQYTIVTPNNSSYLQSPDIHDKRVNAKIQEIERCERHLGTTVIPFHSKEVLTTTLVVKLLPPRSKPVQIEARAGSGSSVMVVDERHVI